MDGYDRAVMLLVDELLPEYEFEYEITDFSSLFSGLDSGRYAAIVDNLSWKEERAARYLYSNEYYLWTTSVIAYQKGRTDITCLEDLCGKSTVTPADGAGRAICSAAAYHGAEKIYVTDIFAESAQALARDINAHFAPVAEYIPHGDYAAIAGCTMVVNATGIGMGESIGQTPLPEEYILPQQFYFDACYNPDRTQFLINAQRKGCKTLNGLGMSLYQGVAQIELWTGRPAPVEAMRRELMSIITEKQHGSSALFQSAE